MNLCPLLIRPIDATNKWICKWTLSSLLMKYHMSDYNLMVQLFNIYLVDEIIFCLLKRPRVSWRWPAFLKMATKPRNLKPQLCGVTVTSVVTSCTFVHAQTMFFSFHPIFSISFDAFVEWYFLSTHSTSNFVSKVISISKKVIVRYQPEGRKMDTDEFRWFTRV